ncbi:MAG TPA: glycosyltransferase family 39 protein [Candidatus Xenobia bacterium]|jgi:hypothetical protein
MKRPLAALVTLAVAVRALAAATGDVYVDEAWTWVVSRQPLLQVLAWNRREDVPPLNYFIWHPLSVAFHSAFILRLPSVLAGAAVVAVVYRMGEQFLSKSQASWAALLVAVLYPFWLIDSEIRHYALLTLGCVRFLQLAMEGRTKGWEAPILAIAVGSLHHSALLPFGAILLAALCYREWLTAAVSGLGVGVTGAWIVYTLTDPQASYRTREAVSYTGLWLLPRMPADMLGLPALFGFHAIPDGLAWALVGVFLLLVGLGCRALQRRTAIYLGFYALLPLAGLALFAHVHLLYYQNRYYETFAPVLFLLLVAGSGARPWVWLPVVLANLGVCAAYPTSPWLWNQQWAPIAHFVEAREKPEDTIVMYVPFNMVAFDYYYDEGRSTFFLAEGAVGVTPRPGHPAQAMIVPASLTPDFDRSLGTGHVFLVLNQGVAPERERILEWFNPRFGIVDQLETRTIGWDAVQVMELTRLPSK